MKRIAFVSPLVVMLALVAGIGATPLQAATRGTTIERYYVTEHWHAFSRPNATDGRPTDLYAFQSAVTTTAGAKVGTVDGVAINLRAPMVYWNATATLPQGTVLVQGAYPLKGGTRVLVIAGGTRGYAGVRGTALLTDAGSRGDLVTLTLLR